MPLDWRLIVSTIFVADLIYSQFVLNKLALACGVFMLCVQIK